MLAISDPGPGESLRQENLIDALPSPSVDVSQETAKAVSNAGTELDSDCVTGKCFDPIGRLGSASPSSFRSVYAEKPDAPHRRVEGVPIDDS